MDDLEALALGAEAPSTEELLAQAIRRRRQQEMLSQANAQANRFGNLAAIAQMANNEGAAQAAAQANKSQQARFKPIQLGNQGFALPQNGQFIPSAIYEDERNATRQVQREQILARQQAAQAALEARQRADQDRQENARQRLLMEQQLGQQNLLLRQAHLAIQQQRLDSQRDKASQPTAAQLKAQAAAEAKAAGRESLTSGLEGLRGLYDDLNKAGGIQSTDRGAGSNIAARLQSSKLGQLVGGAMGTDEQSLRNRIESMRPLIITDIKNATGLSASQLNSNVELQFFLQAATDPTKDIQSNLAAIRELDRRFGTGRLSQELAKMEPPGRRATGVVTTQPAVPPRPWPRPGAGDRFMVD